MNHVRHVCQFGTVHSECRCPGNSVDGAKPELAISCPRPEMCNPEPDIEVLPPGGLTKKGDPQ